MELDSDEDKLILVYVLLLKRRLKENFTEEQESRSVWEKAILQEREMFDDYHRLLQSMKTAGRDNCFQYVIKFVFWAFMHLPGKIEVTSTQMPKRELELGTFCSRERCLNCSATAPSIYNGCMHGI